MKDAAIKLSEQNLDGRKLLIKDGKFLLSAYLPSGRSLIDGL